MSQITENKVVAAPVPMTPLQEFWHYFKRNKGAVVGLAAAVSPLIWARLRRYRSAESLLVIALLLQVVSAVLPALLWWLAARPNRAWWRFTAQWIPLLVLATLDIGHMMLHVAGMSFLGLGVTAPTPEWGVMISDARQLIWTQPLQMLWPGLALFISVMAFNMVGDALRDHLDPHLVTEHAH